MPRLPTPSGRELVRIFERIGFEVTGGRGSHVKLRRGDAVCVVPLHAELKRGTLAGILRQAGLTPEDLLKAMGK